MVKLVRHVVSSTLLLVTCAWGTDADSFIVYEPSDHQKFEGFYFLLGPFLGSGNSVFANNENRVVVPTSWQGKAATRLTIFLHSPGCQLQFMSIDLKNDASREAHAVCDPLPDISFSGVIAGLRVPTGAKPFIEVHFLASWGQAFGYADGPMTGFLIGTAPLTADHGFDLEIPDFSKDKVATEQGKAMLNFFLREDTLNIFELLRPATDSVEGDHLAIRASYNLPVPFLSY